MPKKTAKPYLQRQLEAAKRKLKNCLRSERLDQKDLAQMKTELLDARVTRKVAVTPGVKEMLADMIDSLTAQIADAKEDLAMYKDDIAEYKADIAAVEEAIQNTALTGWRKV